MFASCFIVRVAERVERAVARVGPSAQKRAPKDDKEENRANGETYDHYHAG